VRRTTSIVKSLTLTLTCLCVVAPLFLVRVFWARQREEVGRTFPLVDWLAGWAGPDDSHNSDHCETRDASSSSSSESE